MAEKLIFKKFDGTTIEDISSYVKNWVKDHPYGEVTIGCDSQEHSRHVMYSTVIVMHDIDDTGTGHGAHVISASIKNTSKTVRSDIHSKLWAEAEYTLKVAQMLNGCAKDIKIHLDYNSDEAEYSNALYASGIGMIRGMGFKAEGKPYAWAASNVADNICKGKSSFTVCKN